MTPCRPNRALGLIVTAALWAAGCGSTDEKPPLDSGGKVEGGAEAGVQPEGGGGGKTVAVSYGGKSHAVDLSKPKPVSIGGTSYARLSDVVQLALPGKALGALVADFESQDGFKPSQKDFCKTLIPLAADKLAKGYVNLQSRDMRWDDDLAFPGCMSAKDLAKILLSDK